MIDRQYGYRGSNTMRELLQDNSFLLHAISRFDMAYGFGDETISKICADNNVHTATFLSVCNLISGYPVSIADVSLEALVMYLRHAHRAIIGITLPHIRHHLVEGVTQASATGVSEMLINFFDEYASEVRNHMESEENGIFQYAEKLIAGMMPENTAITVYKSNHAPMSEKLRELKDIFIYHYSLRDNDLLSSVLFDIILCERDLLTHFDVENRLLIPVINAVEKGQRKTATSMPPVAGESKLLGSREKEILRYIAKGLTNKQIADAMYISVHTVATHRRNICSKLDIHTASGLTLYAIVNGIVDIAEIEL